MKTNYTLTKLSSGAMVELHTDNIYSVKTILESWCCVDCVAEANIDKEEDEDLEDVYNLLHTACGAEFILEEDEVEDED